MKKPFNWRRVAVISAIAAALILTCIIFLDARVAQSINSLLNANPYLKKSVKRIPNLLPMVVGVCTAGLFIAYMSVRRSGSSSHAPFLKFAMIVVPAAFLVKMLLQFVFGRTSVRVWLQKGGEIEFSWFTPLSNFPCFPSGHMTVFTAFVVAVWLYYPRFHPIVIVSLTILGASLVVSNFHYLGDVIAGFFCGLLVTAFTSHLIVKMEDAK